jgi:phosphate transport system protein
MAQSVAQRTRTAFDAALTGDADLAMKVRKGDRAIDLMELDIDSECLRILALHTPVASDLRYVLAVLRIDQGLEHIADHAKKIVKRVIDLNEQAPLKAPAFLETMTRAAQRMLEHTVEALAHEDVALAQQVLVEDDIVDERNREAFMWAIKSLTEHGHEPRAILDIQSIARSIERIGDYCSSIAEDLIFAVDGSVVRHESVTATKDQSP